MFNSYVDITNGFSCNDISVACTFWALPVADNSPNSAGSGQLHGFFSRSLRELELVAFWISGGSQNIWNICNMYRRIMVLEYLMTWCPKCPSCGNESIQGADWILNMCFNGGALENCAVESHMCLHQDVNQIQLRGVEVDAFKTQGHSALCM